MHHSEIQEQPEHFIDEEELDRRIKAAIEKSEQTIRNSPAKHITENLNAYYDKFLTGHVPSTYHDAHYANGATENGHHETHIVDGNGYGHTVHGETNYERGTQNSNKQYNSGARRGGEAEKRGSIK